MYAVTGITGNVGSEVAETLLSANKPVRAVVRDAAKAAEWAKRGCELAVATMEDPARLAAAFRGASAVFVLPPPEFDPSPGFPEARAIVDNLSRALVDARPQRVVCLSTVGADASHENLLTLRTILESAFRALAMPVTFLRAAWFLDNVAWDVTAAREQGVLRSFLQPLDKAFPMVAARDVGRTAALLLQQEWAATRVVELEGPRRVSPNDLAATFAHVLGRSVRAESVPRDTWDRLFRDQGMKNPSPRMRMLDGFNEGWIDFRDDGRYTIKGQVTAETVIAELVARGGV
jgi:NAD(P)H dehydrogenase (quinone)